MSQRTPNVPKTRDSFFHRKYRDISNCPPTPATPRIVTNKFNNYYRNQLSHSSTTSSSFRFYSNSPTSSSRRSSKRLKVQDQNDSITSDYSTPRTTRTPTSARLRGKQKITHLIYRPLELDTESSSESNENNFRRRRLLSRSTSPNNINNNNNNTISIETFPAIAAVPANPSQSQQIHEQPPSNTAITEEENIITIPTDTQATEIISASSPVATISITSSTTSTPTNSPAIAVPKSVSGTESVVASSEPPTPPITPEKVKEEISSFVPGNMGIFKTS